MCGGVLVLIVAIVVWVRDSPIGVLRLSWKVHFVRVVTARQTICKLQFSWLADVCQNAANISFQVNLESDIDNICYIRWTCSGLLGISGECCYYQFVLQVNVRACHSCKTLIARCVINYHFVLQVTVRACHSHKTLTARRVINWARQTIDAKPRDILVLKMQVPRVYTRWPRKAGYVHGKLGFMPQRSSLLLMCKGGRPRVVW